MACVCWQISINAAALFLSVGKVSDLRIAVVMSNHWQNSEIIDWLEKELDFEYCGCIHSAREDGDHTFHNRRMEIEWK